MANATAISALPPPAGRSFCFPETETFVARFLLTVRAKLEGRNIDPRQTTILILSLLSLTGAGLPKNGPLPLPRPDATASQQTEAAEKSAPREMQGPPAPTEEKKKKEEAKEPPRPLEREDDETLAACLGELKAAGAIVKEIAPIDPQNGCGIARPVELSRLSADIALEPKATLRCETALQLQRWSQEALVPAVKAAMPDKKLTGLEQASAYVCRNRNNASNGKVSEHAFGNAVDIAAFTFSDGSRLDIAPREKDSTVEGALQRAAVATACLYFTTVLDPGSDAAHETHLHLDVIKRKNGYRYCW
ncbi:hypothetical protein SAMN05892877_109250 [Rhizobium subbaraonis]|uniref:Extensin-like C-terminal domain-containing protein n=1 Tax=Rhizobium subbaraonis TaxID=908946 RepID=A0A285UK18_9HYPH|nr:extensin family protein [Rhizobium subbaraonis]SOC42199.1 hypothetical protein SAMN05892877_109250 [Rhizobium subbaraonis]